MKRIGLLSDTHSCIDARYAEYFADCDEIWHAGDVGDMSVIVALEQIAPLRAVSGNIDHGEVKRYCREVEIFDYFSRYSYRHLCGCFFSLFCPRSYGTAATQVAQW